MDNHPLPNPILNQLEARALSKHLQERVIVHDVSFHVEQGEIVGLLGPNGAGKTTSFYMVVGLLYPTSGHIFLNGQDISKVPMHRRAKMGIGYLPQNSSIFRKLSVRDNLFAVMEITGVPKNRRQELGEQLMEGFGLGNIAQTPGYALSGGERRKVEIARLLILSPKFLLLDEPFAGIDPITVNEIQELIKNLVKRENIGVLITDHQVRETLSICSRAYILAQGRILVEGPPNHITAQEEVKKLYLGHNYM